MLAEDGAHKEPERKYERQAGSIITMNANSLGFGLVLANDATPAMIVPWTKIAQFFI
jgi:hypothetical protein